MKLNGNTFLNKLSVANKAKGKQDLNQNKQELKEACQHFEAIFLNQMLEQMQKTVPDGYLKKSSTEKMYQSMLNEKLAENMSKSGGIGLSEILYKQLDQN